MTALEREELRDLAFRLFGEDGQGGALGELRAEVREIRGDTRVLMNDKIVRDTLRDQNDSMREDRRRAGERRDLFRLSTVGILGGVVAALAGAVVLPFIDHLLTRGGF